MIATKRRALKIARALARHYEPRCALHHASTFELLVATVLSAQCTDVKVNQVTTELWRTYRRPRDYYEAPEGALEAAIRPTGFFNQKARSLRAIARAIDERFGGEVPSALDALTSLPGVGVKTANVVRGTAFGLPAVFVDTHVGRIARRLGLTSAEDPDKVTSDLERLLPLEEWTQFCHRVIWHGRGPCKARRPACGDCPIRGLCPWPGKETP